MWALNADKTYEGTYSIRSPILEDQGETSTARLNICDDFPGGVLTLQVYSSTSPPDNRFGIFVDNIPITEVNDGNKWDSTGIDLAPGGHVVDFVYLSQVAGQEGTSSLGLHTS